MEKLFLPAVKRARQFEDKFRHLNMIITFEVGSIGIMIRVKYLNRQNSTLVDYCEIENAKFDVLLSNLEELVGSI